MTEFGIVKLHEMLKNKEITSDELVQESLKKSHDVQDKCNAFVTILDDAKGLDITSDLLSGIPFGIKDNYSTKGILTTGSSNTLKDYVPIFDATAVKNLKKHGAIAVNKTALDEFGMGGTGTTAHTGIIKNPWDQSRICAGSSSGSAAAVASGVYPFALGSDTGDSVRKPAAFCGVVGYKPTYGMISRFGLFPFASSLDTCGVFTRSVEDAAIVVDAMKGLDEHDLTTWDSSNIQLYESLDKNIGKKKLFYIKELAEIENYPHASDELKKHLKLFHQVLEKVRKEDVVIEAVSMDDYLLKALPSVYVCLSCAEATSNMSNLTGISFGPRGSGENINEMIKDYRTKGFSSLIKRRFIIGSYVLEKENQERYFRNAARVRRLITDKMKSFFKNYDAMIMPVSTGIAPKISDVLEKLEDRETSALQECLQIGNYGGFPSITIPSGFIDGMPVGINITGNCFEDVKVLNIAYAIEDMLDLKVRIAGEKHE